MCCAQITFVHVTQICTAQTHGLREHICAAFSSGREDPVHMVIEKYEAHISTGKMRATCAWTLSTQATNMDT